MKKEYLILIAIIVALGLYLGLRTRDQTHFDLPSPEFLESGVIDRLVIARPAGTVELVKKDAKWFIEPQGFRADDITVGNMLNQIAELKVTDLVSESKSYERYDLNAEQRINVQAYTGGQKQRDFDIGRPAPTFQHTFVKLGEDPNIYNARGNLKNTFDKELESLRDKVVVAFERDSLTAIDIRKGDQSVVLEKRPVQTTSGNDETPKKDGQAENDVPAQTEWHSADGRTVDQAVLDELLSAMSQLKCEGYLEEPPAPGDAQWSLTFSADQQTHTLTLFPKAQEGNRFPARSTDSAYDFWLPESRVKVFEQQIDRLLGIAPQKAQS